MTAIRRQYVLATFITSCIALILLIVAISTNYWISSTLQSNGVAVERGSVNYGLFSGTYSKGIFNPPVALDLALVCDYGENACVWSCAVDKDSRKKELTSLLQNGPAFMQACLISASRETHQRPMPKSFKKLTRDDGDAERRFINAGLWLCTMLSLIFGMVFTLISAFLSLVNVTSNPRVPILSVDGLYIWNGFSALMDLLCLILWGSQFAITLKHNIAINETADRASTTQYSSDGLASIGWSYWMVLVALILSAANICILFVRNYLIQKQPPPPEYTPEREVADGTLFLY